MNFVSHWCCFGILTAAILKLLLNRFPDLFLKMYCNKYSNYVSLDVMFRAATCRLCFSFSRMADDGFSFYSMAFKSCKEYNFR